VLCSHHFLRVLARLCLRFFVAIVSLVKPARTPDGFAVNKPVGDLWTATNVAPKNRATCAGESLRRPSILAANLA
jgi:hypothetical protein